MNKMMLVLLTLVASVSHAAGWFDNGTTSEKEYTQQRGKDSFVITCGPQVTASMDLTVDGVLYGTNGRQPFDLVVDGKRFETPYDLSSPKGVRTFQFAMEALRNGSKAAVVYGPGKDRFELDQSNAQRVLPDPQADDFPCTANPERISVDDELPAPMDDPNQTAVQPASPPEFRANVGHYSLDYRIDATRNIVLTSLNDDIVVTGIVVNRGMCHFITPEMARAKGVKQPTPGFPTRMSYGEVQAWPLVMLEPKCNEIYEFVVQTNQGNVKFTQNSN